MILAFKLSMPRNNSWNGRWSGDEKIYVKTRSFRENKELEARKLIGRHYYDFGDGWCAAIDVEEVDSSKSRQLNKKSLGFCGYEWMIESLLNSGSIQPPKR